MNNQPANVDKNVRFKERPLSSSSTTGSAENKKPPSPNVDKYTKPSLNSTKKVAQKIEDIKSGKGFTESDITAPYSALMQEKLTQKLNFPPDRSVFHGLCPVNVNDSVLEIDIQRKRRKRYSVPKQRQERDPEPVLQDFLDPVILFEQSEGLEDVDDNAIQYARFIESVSLKHRPPICTTLDNVQTVFHFFD